MLTKHPCQTTSKSLIRRILHTQSSGKYWAVPNPSPLSLESVHYAPRKFFTLPSSQGWPPWTRKVKCIQTAGTKNVYYFVGTRLRLRPRTENHHSVICLSWISCNLISDDCTPHNVYETLSKKKLQRFDLFIYKYIVWKKFLLIY